MQFKDYRVGWICALPTEIAAAVCLLDEQHPPLSQSPHDHNVYTLGRVGSHNVVIACLPAGVLGSAPAARVATRMRSTFAHIEFCLMVGIGGGVPSKRHDIRLGDIVVSQPVGLSASVIQYDFGKTIQEGRFCRTGSLNRPPDILLNAVAALRARHMYQPSQIGPIVTEALARYPQRRAASTYPGSVHDRLFEASYIHAGGQDDDLCSHCDFDRQIQRVQRPATAPLIHHGPIASGNQIMRNALVRDRLQRDLGVLCFEMEAAGLIDDFPCLVIRGICDYADSHKHKLWQDYAASVAAAYAKELLSVIPAVQEQSQVTTPRMMSPKTTTTSLFSTSTRDATTTQHNLSLLSTGTSDVGTTSINVLYDAATVVADVVFVHGPFGMHGNVWKHCLREERQTLAKQHESRSNLRSLFRKRKLKYETSVTERMVDWPRELLPLSHTDIRVLMIEFDRSRSSDFGDPGCLIVYADSILHALAQKRHDCPDRPVIYIAHGLGGMLVKQAVITSCSLPRENPLARIGHNTRSILFFGTPHYPTSEREWVSSIQGVFQSTQVNFGRYLTERLTVLLDTGCMRILNEDFCEVINKAQIRNINFLELDSQARNGTVSTRSANLRLADNVIDIFTNATYKAICNFTSLDSGQYKQFDAVFQNCLASTATDDRMTPSVNNGAQAEIRSELLETLKYSGMTARQEQLSTNDISDDTLEWVWSKDTNMQAWLADGKEIFFISGKPASGKSTLVSHLCTHSRTRSLLNQNSSAANWDVLQFFFDFRAGKGLANSFEGLLRSLITQLVDNLSYDSLPDLIRESLSTLTNDLDRMRRLILDLLRSDKQYCIFIDGLDEYEGDLLHLVTYLRELQKQVNLRDENDQRPITLKMCIASRPDPAIMVGLSDSPGFRMQEHNMQGLNRYTSLTLAKSFGDFADDNELMLFASEVAVHAEGVFLWARFALKEIIEGYTYGEAWDELRARLQQVPKDLEQIYARIMGKLRPGHMSEAYAMLVLVWHAKRPLSLYEFLVFSQLAANKFSQENLKMSVTSLERRIAARSGGLLVVAESYEGGVNMTSKVKLIHATARSFLQSEATRKHIDRALHSLTGYTSNTLWLKICCQFLDGYCMRGDISGLDSVLLGPRQYDDNERRTDVDMHELLDQSRMQAEGSLSAAVKADASSLLQYTSLYVFDHARAAEKEASSFGILNRLPIVLVLSIHARCCQPCCPCCADLRLLRQFLNVDVDFVDDRCRTAMIHGLSQYFQDAIDGGHIDVRDGKALLFAIANCFRAHKTADVSTDQHLRIVKILLQAGVKMGQEHVRLALKVGGSDLLNLLFHHIDHSVWVGSDPPFSQTPLFALITQRYLGPSFGGTVETLSLRGISLDELCGNGASVFHAPLSLWTHGNYTEVQGEVAKEKPAILPESLTELQYLESFAWGEDNRTRNLEEKCIQLMNLGASVNLPDRNSKTPLQVAWERVNTGGTTAEEHVHILQPVIRALLQFRASLEWPGCPTRPEVLAYTRLGLRDITQVTGANSQQLKGIWQEKVRDRELRATNRVSGMYAGVSLPDSRKSFEFRQTSWQVMKKRGGIPEIPEQSVKY